MELKGCITKATTRDTWACLIIETEEKESIKATGTIINPVIGEELTLVGDYTEHPKYGRTFKFTNVSRKRTVTMDEKEGIVGFLTKFAIGCGQVMAERIYDQFGTTTMDVIQNNPKELSKVKGISEKKAMSIHYSCVEQFPKYELSSFLGADATAYNVNTLYEKFGDNAVDMLKQNPYCLVYELKGFGFLKADQLALKCASKPAPEYRVTAALYHMLQEMANAGHCYCEVENIETMMDTYLKNAKVEVDLIVDCIVAGVEKGLFYVENERLYLKNIYVKECFIAVTIKSMLEDAPHVSFKDMDKVIEEEEKRSGITFDDLQKDAVKLPTKYNVSVLTGGPGMGKSTITRLICNGAKGSVILLAPTGRAAKRLTETTGVQAYTIARFRMMMENSETSDVSNTLFVVDEASMVDLNNATWLFKFCENGTLFIIGDADQLPSIGAGKVLNDLISGGVPYIQLKFSYRFGGSIGYNCACINKGYGPSYFKNDDGQFEFIKMKKGDDMMDTLLKLYPKLLDKYAPSDVMVMSATRNGYNPLRVSEINRVIQEKMNPKPFIGGTKFKVGDRVMQTVNDYRRRTITPKGGCSSGVFNGDIGTIESVAEYSTFDKTEEPTTVITVLFDDGFRAEYNITEANNLLCLSYGFTYHKAQGSEAACAVCLLSRGDMYMISRNLLYVGASRAKKKLYIIGESWVIDACVKKAELNTRKTTLSNRIHIALSA